MGVVRTRYWLWGILAVALTLRVVAAVLVQQYVSQTPGRLCLIAGDAEGYWELGQKLAHGQNFEIYDPPRRVLRMPGFPAVLAISIAFFGDHAGAARIILALIGTLACGAVYWLGAELFDRQVGLIAAGLAAVSPALVMTSVMILSETTFALGLLASLLSLVWLVRSPPQSGWRVFGKGLIAGLGGAAACYVRPSWLLFPPLAAAWLVIMAWRGTAGGLPGPRKVAVGAAVAGMLSGLVIGLLPWTLRNYVVTGGHIVPTTLWMGPSLYDGLNPTANGDSHMEFLQHDALYQSLSEYEVDRHYRREAWNWAARNPAKVIELGWIKLGRYWNLWPNAPQFHHWIVRLGLLCYLLPVLICTAWGLYAGRVWRAETISWSWIVIITVAPILYFAGLHTLFVSSLRYRLPAEYPLLVMSAAGLRDLYHRLRPIPAG